MAETIDVLGAGLSGRLMALKLARLGFRVRLRDKGGPSGEKAAAYAAAAMLSPLAEAVDATPMVLKLAKNSARLWADLLKTLKTPVFMQTNGTLVVWDRGDAGLAERFDRELLRGAGQRLWEEWDGAEIDRREPELKGRFSRGFYLPGEGQLDGRQVLDALRVELQGLGAKFSWNDDADRPAPLDWGAADWTIDCRGFGAKDDWNGEQTAADRPSKLRGVRGEVARVYAPKARLSRPVRLLHPRYPLYIAPKENHVFVIGATQIESDDDSNVTVRSGLELFSALYAVHPGFGEARILELLTRLRPTLNHHDPEIRIDPKRRLMRVNGLFRHGFMISPAVTDAAVEIFSALRAGKTPSADSVYGLPAVAPADR